MAENRQERAVEAWSPFRDLGFGGLGRVFDELMAGRPFAAAGGRWSPALDVSENEKSWILTVELPGARREDVSVEVHEDLLTIRGEKRCEREEKEEKRHYVERCYGSFTRSLRLPANVDPDGIRASFRDGVLTVEVPKTETQKPRTIDIKAA